MGLEGDSLCAQYALFDALCSSWGGANREWVDLANAVGAEWTALPSSADVAWRRHRLLKALLSFHDPTLSLHLETYASGWKRVSRNCGTDKDPYGKNYPPSGILFGRMMPGSLPPTQSSVYGMQ